jgi:hypothetical protein
MVVFDDLSIEGLRRYRFSAPTAKAFLVRLAEAGLLKWPT